MNRLLSAHTKKRIVEPDDKRAIKEDYIYLAPQNYHLLIKSDSTFSLDYSEVVQYCRPSIDVTFESAAKAFGKNVLAIVLSGANKDGADGIKKVIEKGGEALVQDPATAVYPIMPLAVMEINDGITILQPDKIVDFLNHVSNSAL